MAEVIQIKCGHCQKELRIPANWLGQAMRCKFCQQVFQARKKPASPAAVAPAPPAVPSAPAAPTAKGDPFAFDTAAPTVRAHRVKAGSKGSGTFKLLLLGCGILTIAGIAAAAAVVVLGTHVYHQLFPTNSEVRQAKNTPTRDCRLPRCDVGLPQ